MSKIVWSAYYILLLVLYKIGLLAFLFPIALNISPLSNSNNVFHQRAGHPTEPATSKYTKKPRFLILNISTTT